MGASRSHSPPDPFHESLQTSGRLSARFIHTGSRLSWILHLLASLQDTTARCQSNFYWHHLLTIPMSLSNSSYALLSCDPTLLHYSHSRFAFINSISYQSKSGSSRSSKWQASSENGPLLCRLATSTQNTAGNRESKQQVSTSVCIRSNAH